MEQPKAIIIVHSGELDKIMNAFIIGGGYLTMGVPTSLFFTFWGLYALKKRRFLAMPLSRINVVGLGTLVIKKRMKKAGMAGLYELAAGFKTHGGKIVACTMTMDLLGLKEKDLRGDLIDEYGTIGEFCYESKDANITLFI